MRSFHIRNFGCRASQADGAAIEGDLRSHGWERATPEDAGLVVLNSCTVTATADRDLAQAVRRTRRENPQARILVTGCYAQREPEAIARLGVDWVVGNSHKDQIAQLLADSGAPSYHAQIHVGDIHARREFFSGAIDDAPDGRARPHLKVQDGCNNRCSFCVIPSVRGASRSAQPDWVLTQIRSLAARYAEVVLTGVNLGRWGREWGAGRQLEDLIRRILAETDVRRLRLSSVEPMDWTDGLIELVSTEPRIAKHMHAPLQSGSDAVLRRMHRKYRPRHYQDRIRRAALLMPRAAFGADVMTGFPGETDAEFAESVAFIESLPFTYLHVFTYSEREGTRAVELPNRVPVEVRRERTQVLRELSARKNRAFRASLAGKTLSVVTLGGRDAMASSYVSVELAREHPAQEILDICAGAATATGVAEYQALPVLA